MAVPGDSPQYETGAGVFDYLGTDRQSVRRAGGQSVRNGIIQCLDASFGNGVDLSFITRTAGKSSDVGCFPRRDKSIYDSNEQSAPC